MAAMAAKRMTLLLEDIRVDAIMCSLNEEDYIEKSLISALEQTLMDDNPENVRLTLADSGSTDRTLDIAKKYDVDVLDVPRGKLTARDAAIRASQGDIIIALDSDTIYPSGFYSELIKHFSNPSVVAVGGYRRMTNDLGQMSEDLASILSQAGIWHRMCGGASAFTKKAYVAIGGFDLSINQKNIYEMMYEEEVKFGTRLSKVGRYVFEPRAFADTSSRRVNLDPKFYKRILNGETF